MINNSKRILLKEWFDKYVNTFLTDDLEFNHNINLKIQHTYNVCNEIIDICKSLSLDESQINTAYVIALFHDVGRFEQYKQYQTFHDAISENHSTIGIKVLRDQNILKEIDTDTSHLIIKAIANHNTLSLKKNINPNVLLFSQMVRDADKLDIYRLCCDEYLKNKYDPTIGLGLPDTHEVTDRIFHQLMNEEAILYENLKSYTDFKMIKFGWINDINFHYTFKLIKERKHLDIILNSINANEKVNLIYTKYNSILENKIELTSRIN